MAVDINTYLRDPATGTLTASEQSATGVLMGKDLVPQTYAVFVPSTTGTDPKLDVKIQESDNNSTWRDFLAFPQIIAAGIYFVTGQSNAPYRRQYSTITGTSPGFGAVAIMPMPAGRDVNW